MGRKRKFNEYDIVGKFAFLNCKHGKVKIDLKNLDKIKQYTWFTKKSQNSEYYVYTSITENKKERKISLHRFLMSADPNILVDHKNRDTLDNTLENLRLCTRAENNRNAKKNIRGKSKYKGVTIRPSGRFGVYIQESGKPKCLGTFDCEKEAALAYNKRALEIFGQFANLNEIKGVK